MIYSFSEFSIKEIVTLVNRNMIDLNPSYQRNFIWSPKNQTELIDTILSRHPIPCFFFYKKTDGFYEMVDGQQRTKTIYRFQNNEITSSKAFGKVKYDGIDKDYFDSYKIPVVVIEKLEQGDSLEEFYVKINKQGVHLNDAEINKSAYHSKKFLKLSNDLLSYQSLINLDLFTTTASKRMNDRAFIEELLAYLLLGAKDKKKSVDNLFESDITDEEVKFLDEEFRLIIDKIEQLNHLSPISETRYKQKNDFYTLFSFVHENGDVNLSLLKYQYRILLILNGTDEEGRQMIRPSNEDCEAIRNYAINCVTQSNSKTSRDKRLQFFRDILQNKNMEGNPTLDDVLNYLSNLFGPKKVKLKKIEEFYLLDIDKLNE